ncbi:olfactory receptor 10C1-like [Discoglossus pictus]
MLGESYTNVTKFILLGFSDLPLSLQAILFTFLISAYVFTLLGNGLIILVVSASNLFMKPMYFFLRNLSFLELCYTSVTVPKTLENFLSEDKSISFSGCAFQMYTILTIGLSECAFLGVMAFDRYMAICHPLVYGSLMQRSLCCQLIIGSWLLGSLMSLGLTSFIFTLPFCDSNYIDHFFCDIQPVLHVACADTFNRELLVFMSCLFGAMIPFLVILCSYIKILSSIFLIQCVNGRLKAFSTCGSHLVSVLLYYGTILFVHLRLGTHLPSGKDRMTALFYCIVIPAINPLIYSLRNTELRTALRKLTKRTLNIYPYLSLNQRSISIT